MPYVAGGSTFGASYDVQDLQVVQYTPPRELYLTLVPNSLTQLQLRGSGLFVELSAFLSSSSFLLRSETLFFDLQDLAFVIGFAIRAGAGNRAAVVITECGFSYGSIDVSRGSLSGSRIVSSIVNGIVERKLRSFFDGKVCDILQNEGSAKLTEWIARVPGEVNLFERQRRHYREKRAPMRFTTLSRDKLAEQLLSLASKLSLDLHIVGNPQVLSAGTSAFLEIPLSGQVRIRDVPSVPFYPKPMPPVRTNQYHHFYLIISEFTLNSMLYQMYANDLMNTVIEGSRSSSEMKEFLQTSCGGGRCIGTLFPSAFSGVKQQYLQMRVFPHTCPMVKIQGSKGILIELALIVQFYSQPPKRKMLYSLNLHGSGRLIIQSKLDRITGKYTSLDMQFQHKDKTNSDVWDLLSDVASAAIEAKVNEIFERGFRIPSLGIGRLKNLKIQTDNNVIWIGVNLIFDTAVIQRAVSNLVQNKMAVSSPSAYYY
uniref:Lipid-binding serum glycoprotein C-terminal domain-containing protein n=1 Tax=Trichuris muris TaxID=70415 RepID=A0A5S6R658_TRIMR